MTTKFVVVNGRDEPVAIAGSDNIAIALVHLRVATLILSGRKLKELLGEGFKIKKFDFDKDKAYVDETCFEMEEMIGKKKK